MRVIERIFESFFYTNDDLQLKQLVAAWIGFLGHPLYWLIWRIYYPHYEDSFFIRFSSAILCLLIILQKYWPEKLKKFAPLIWNLTVMYATSVLFTYTFIVNNYDGIWMGTHIGMIVLLLLLVPDIVLFFCLLLSGTAIGIIWYMISTNNSLHTAFSTFPYEYIPVLAFIVFAGAVFLHLSTRAIVNSERRIAKEQQKVDDFKILSASIAHEMRNPLGQIKYNLDTIQHRLPMHYSSHPPEPMQPGDLDEIYQLVAHGQMAVNRGIQVISMTLEQFHDKAIDPGELAFLSAGKIIRKAVDEYGYESVKERSSVTLQNKEDFIFRVDETMFVFVLFNLLKNALYYLHTNPQSQITIKLQAGQDANRIWFKDTGPGIANELMEHLFDGFFTAGKRSGTGLGLSYCKRVLNAFAGDIRCESVEDEFTEFELTFPVVSDYDLHNYQQQIITEARPDLHGRRVLVVDDDMQQQALVRGHLSPLAMEIDSAKDGRQALVMSRDKRYDLIIMDLYMPVMNGYEAAERLRAGESGRMVQNTPIIAYTSEPPYIAKGRVEKVGMESLICKPCTQAELIITLRSALKNRQICAICVGLHIVFLDDEPGNLEMMGNLIEETGIRVTRVSSAKKALDALRAQPCDLFLTDMHLPDMSGLELIHTLKSGNLPHLANLPIIGLSGDSDVKQIEKAKQAGINEYLIKPAAIRLILDTIAKLLYFEAPPAQRQKSGLQLPGKLNVTDAKIVDLDRAAVELGVEKALLQRRFELFISQCEDYKEQIQQCIEDDDKEALFNVVHKLKGAAMLFHADTLVQVAEQLEQRCRHQAGCIVGQAADLTAALSKLILRYPQK